MIIEALDFDWIFYKDNTTHMITLLAERARTEILVRKALRVFVQLIWEQYLPVIEMKVFYPYLMYMLCYILMASYAAGNYLSHIFHPTMVKSDDWDSTFGIVH